MLTAVLHNLLKYRAKYCLKEKRKGDKFLLHEKFFKCKRKGHEIKMFLQAIKSGCGMLIQNHSETKPKVNSLNLT
jgi:hypothetical protein